jgi:hypothetical protein
MWVARGQPVLELDDPNAPVFELPETRPTLLAGLHYLLSVVVLIWCLMVEQMSPALSAFWATLFMVFVMLTQRPLMAVLRGQGKLGAAARVGFRDLIRVGGRGPQHDRHRCGHRCRRHHRRHGLADRHRPGDDRSRRTAVRRQPDADAVLVAVISLILGMGLPTTANYIVVSTLMAPVVVELGAQSGLLVPLIAVHLFVFYFGLMADVTPPVGLASFAAAAIARSDPIKTGITAFYYSMRTAILPFLFIFNTQLLLIGIDSWMHLLLTIAISVVAMLVFAAATQGYFLVRSRWYESIALLLVTFALFRPGFFWDEVYAPYVDAPPAEFMKLVEAAPAGANKRVWIEGQNMDGKDVRKGVLMPLGDAGPARERLRKLGLTVVPLGGEMQIAQVQFGSKAEKLGIEQGFKIAGIEMPADRPKKEWVFIPALALLGVIVALQMARGRREAAPRVAAA